MASFQIAHAITAGNEGGYANHPNDTGLETYAGISRKFNPQWKGWPLVDEAKQGNASASTINKRLAANPAVLPLVHSFYLANYWDANKLGQLTNQDIANKLYDVGVNMGIGRASRMLQEALNLTNANGRAYADIVVDGAIGPKTITTANGHPNQRVLLLVLDALQGERYLNIMRNAPSQEVFANTWFSRI